jgi:hypothetical protein
MVKKKLPPDVLEFFRKEGAKGGRKGGSLGGKTAAANLTPEQRSARAKKGSDAAVLARKRRSKGAQKKRTNGKAPS